MKQSTLRLVIGFSICLVLGLLFGYLTTTFSDTTMPKFDETLISAIQGLETPWLTKIMKIFTWIGSGYIVGTITVIAALLLFFVYKMHRQAVLLVVVILGTVALKHYLKLYFKRERPTFHQLVDAPEFSFPSGHTMMALGLYVMIVYIAWRHAKTSWLKCLFVLFATFMIIMIGTSRIYLGVHFPSDVVGGILASGFLVTIAVMVDGLFHNRSSKNEASS